MQFNIDRKIGEIVYIDPKTIDIENSPTQISNRRDQNIVAEYAEKMVAGLWDFQRQSSYPQLFLNEAKIHLIGDGHHTLEAAVLADRPPIPCFVSPGELIDAKLYSFKYANRFNGLTLSNQQKKISSSPPSYDRDILAAIAVACGGNPDDIPSARAISNYLNEEVSTVTIGKLIAAAIAAGDCLWLDTEKAVGMDGRLQPTTKKKKTTPLPSTDLDSPPSISKTLEKRGGDKAAKRRYSRSRR
ncbi:MAG: hypothetical protein HC778_02970 [Chamaesiphon sp. CSU_1_12]|nr:hypothetical protein [Chamaesiphon sp. CSU_1_12]